MAVSQFRSSVLSNNQRFNKLDNSALSYDPYWDRVALLLQDGDITNNAPNGIGIDSYRGTTASPSLSSTDRVLSGSTKSIAIGNSNKFLRYATNSLWNDFSQGFTYEFYVNFSSFGGPYFFSRWNNNSGGLYQTNIYTGNDGSCGWTFRNNNTTSDLFSLNIGTLSTNQWYHIACVIDGVQASGTARVFLNGSQVNSIAYSSNGLLTNSFTDMSLGFKQDGGDPAGIYTGLYYIDRVRFTAKTRYTSNFTPPVGLLPTRGQ